MVGATVMYLLLWEIWSLLLLWMLKQLKRMNFSQFCQFFLFETKYIIMSVRFGADKLEQ